MQAFIKFIVEIAFLINGLQFSKYKIMSSVNNITYMSLNCMPSIYFTLIILTRPTLHNHNNNNNNNSFLLFPVDGNVSNVFLFSVCVCVYTHLLRSLYMYLAISIYVERKIHIVLKDIFKYRIICRNMYQYM